MQSTNAPGPIVAPKGAVAQALSYPSAPDRNSAGVLDLPGPAGAPGRKVAGALRIIRAQAPDLVVDAARVGDLLAGWYESDPERTAVLLAGPERTLADDVAAALRQNGGTMNTMNCGGPTVPEAGLLAGGCRASQAGEEGGRA